MIQLSPQQSRQAKMFITKKKGLHIVQYCQVHKGDTPHNSNQPRTKCDIFMEPSRNIQGGFKFMSLRSMNRLQGNLGI